MRRLLKAVALAVSVASGGCTVHHSRQAVGADLEHIPPGSSRFVTEDDGGLLLFGIISLSEPDHYSVLLERARRKHKCGHLAQGQLDFYTDHWLIVAFPVARLTLLCEPAQHAEHEGD